MYKEILPIVLAAFSMALFNAFPGTNTSELSEEIWLLPDETVDLSCRAERLGAIFEDLTTRWEKDKGHVAATAQIELLPDAGLRLNSLRLTDSGIYVCKGRVFDMVVDINTIRLHVGSGMQEELVSRGGSWLSNQDSMGIPNVWSLAFVLSFLACVLFGLAMLIMRTYYRSVMRKYDTYG